MVEVYRLYSDNQAEVTQDSNLIIPQIACRQVFTEEFNTMNIGLYQPKKDQCDKCCAYKV